MQTGLESDFNVAKHKFFVVTVMISFAAFYFSTLAMVVFFYYGGLAFPVTAAFMCLLYFFVLVVSLKRVLDRLSLAALMLFIPIAPFAILVALLSYIPIIQILHH